MCIIFTRWVPNSVNHMCLIIIKLLIWQDIDLISFLEDVPLKTGLLAI